MHVAFTPKHVKSKSRGKRCPKALHYLGTVFKAATSCSGPHFIHSTEKQNKTRTAGFPTDTIASIEVAPGRKPHPLNKFVKKKKFPSVLIMPPVSQ